MEYIKIKINKRFTGETEVNSINNDGEQIKYVDNYWVYSKTIGNNITSEFNVKDFLNAKENELLAVKFFNFLQSNISIEEFRNVFYNNKKLSLTFNEFYLKNSKNENISINNENRINVVADNERRRNTILTSVTTHIVSQDPNNLNQRTNQNITTSTYDLTTLSQNYYITFLINLNIDTISSGDFSRFAKDKF